MKRLISVITVLSLLTVNASNGFTVGFRKPKESIVKIAVIVCGTPIAIFGVTKLFSYIKNHITNSSSSNSSTNTKAETPCEPEKDYNSEDTECHICFNPYENSGDKSKILLSCGHSYCKICLKEWVQKNLTCPTCRKKLNSEDIKIVNEESKKLVFIFLSH